ncbi:MAG TPA: tetratricopeptide repeat protein [Burkholderiales bacterium]|nr:tetratricopeptide repeat protein [Burkholderiales bacterium]
MTDAPTERGDEGAWARLHRRKVVQWALAYAAAAWALLQGLEYVTNTFHWPEQFQQFSTIALLIGVPIVVVIAWYHGDRGEQRVSGAELTIIVLLLLLAGGFLWHYQQPGEKSAASDSVAGPVPAATAPAAAPAVADTRPSIAVLPFENRSRLADDVFFVDGIHDDILTKLSKVSALKVISRTSVEKFRDTQLSATEIATQLGVKNLLEGGVQRAGDRVHINVQLIDARTDEHLWAESYDRELTAANIFAIQGEVAAAIAGALKAALTEGERARVNLIPTHSLEAWEAYQLGQQRVARRTAAALAEAETFFRRAIELDPKFARAHAGLAYSLILLTVYTNVQLAPTLDKAQQSVDTALTLDPGLSDAWVAAGMIAGGRGQDADAERLLRRAVELDPNNSRALLSLAQQLGIASRFDEAVTTVRQAADLDPLSAIIQVNLGGMLGSTGDFAEAASRCRRAIAIDPAFAVGYRCLSRVSAYGMNRFAEAVPLAQKAAELDPESPLHLLNLASLRLALGDDQSFVETIGQAASRWPDDPNVHCALAMADLGRGDAAGVLQHAQRSAEADSRNDSARRCGLFLLRDADLRDGRYDRALERYRKAYPELFAQASPRIDARNYRVAVEVVPVLQALARTDEARALLDGIERAIRPLPRLGDGFGIADAQVLSLRAETGKALAALRQAEREGWRSPFWRYARNFDPTLASIRNEPEFKAVFADIERDMARQREELAKRPKNAPL